jgi:hypothetical protein
VFGAQARMMSGLLRHFGSAWLALATYNAGSGCCCHRSTCGWSPESRPD